MHARSTNINNMIFIAEATFTRFSRFKKSITVIIKIPVDIMEKWGVLNRLFTFAKNSGKSWSRLIAIGKRDADNMPALAVETKASIPANAIIMLPTVPKILYPPVDMGVSDHANSCSSSKPTVTKVVNP